MTARDSHASLREAVDAPVGAPDRPRPHVDSWSATIKAVFSDTDLRLDASSYDPKVVGIPQALAQRGIAVEPLGDLATITLPNRFERVWALDAEHGVPYLNATDLLSLFSFGRPAADMRYLSHATNYDVDSLLVREGWILMTCSGTVGRVFYVGRRLNGWAATHDIIRIVPNDPEMTGYLYAWLSSDAARTQIGGRQHGGQIRHVTGGHMAALPIPRLDAAEEARIGARVMAALESRERAIESLTEAWTL